MEDKIDRLLEILHIGTFIAGVIVLFRIDWSLREGRELNIMIQFPEKSLSQEKEENQDA